MPELVKKIEKITDLKLHPAPDRDGGLPAAVMPFKENFPKYALDQAGNIIGLTSGRERPMPPRRADGSACGG